MRYIRLGGTYIVRLMTGEEVAGAIVEFAADQRIDAGHVSGIGAAYDVTLGYFDRATREYVRHTFNEEMEILSLSGTIAIKEGRPLGHIHATFGRRDFTTVGGHLFEARTGATCELVIQPLAGYVQRVKDEATGLFLLEV